jgi:hypothetical protein
LKLTPPSSREPAVDPRTGTFSRTWITYFQQLFDRVGGIAGELITLGDFRGDNQLLSENGFQRLPGGLVRQWGTATTDATGSVWVHFPTTFARQCVSLQCQETGVESASGITFAHSQLEKDAVTIHSSGVGTTNAAKRFNWEALGY